MPFHFDTSYARLPEHFYQRVAPTPVSRPGLIAVNQALAEQLGVSPEGLASPEGVALLAGNRVLEGTSPLALAYAGHQFGHFVPQLGDGRAILLGEVVDRDGRRRDIQLKGSGRTRFSRGGDGRAALGPVLREYLVSEAMAALGVPTTRSLAAVTTGEVVRRETPLPGAILTRVASSHLRIGTFEYFAARRDSQAIVELTRYALARHYPEAPTPAGPAVALLDQVIGAQAKLVARWMALGFVHGVMNTDNCSIAGETIDYGPCAFLDAYHPSRTFSSIDEQGRYAFGNQPRIALWNLTRLAEALLPTVDPDEDRAEAVLTEHLESYSGRFNAHYAAELRKKLGLMTERDGDLELALGLLAPMAEQRVDYTLCFRGLANVLLGDDTKVVRLFSEPAPLREWLERWRRRLALDERPVEEQVALMGSVNPAFIPRNHQVEAMITAATEGDRAPFFRLLSVLADPYREQAEAADLAEAPGQDQFGYRTFCGT
jgi:uncharacterized protein YdiU (UPF0061 family)